MFTFNYHIHVCTLQELVDRSLATEVVRSQNLCQGKSSAKCKRKIKDVKDMAWKSDTAIFGNKDRKINQFNANNEESVDWTNASHEFDDVIIEDDVDYIHSEEFSVLTQDASRHWNEYDKKALGVFLLSGIGLNKTLALGGFKREIRMNGWEALKHRHAFIKCCYLWNNNKFTQFINPQRSYWKLAYRLAATQYTCPIKGQFKDLIGISINFKKKKCPTDHTVYVEPEVALKPPKRSFAICVKIVYGSIDLQSFVHWIEYYREMKVHKIFMYTYNISKEALGVINRYTKEGFVDSRPFNYPWKGRSMYFIEILFQMCTYLAGETNLFFCCLSLLNL